MLHSYAVQVIRCGETCKNLGPEKQFGLCGDREIFESGAAPAALIRFRCRPEQGAAYTVLVPQVPAMPRYLTGDKADLAGTLKEM